MNDWIWTTNSNKKEQASEWQIGQNSGEHVKREWPTWAVFSSSAVSPENMSVELSPKRWIFGSAPGMKVALCVVRFPRKCWNLKQSAALWWKRGNRNSIPQKSSPHVSQCTRAGTSSHSTHKRCFAIAPNLRLNILKPHLEE